MNIRPLGDRVIVRRTEEEKTTTGGIYIPDSATEKPSEGEVIAVGKGKLSDNGDLLAMHVVVGEKIIFSKYAGSEIKVNGETYLIMKEEDILAVLG